MADYESYPLWEAGPSMVGNIDPDDLPISEELKQELRKWAEEYDSTLNMSDPASSGFPNAESEREFREKGYALGQRLEAELGSAFVVIVQA